MSALYHNLQSKSISIWWMVLLFTIYPMHVNSTHSETQAAIHNILLKAHLYKISLAIKDKQKKKKFVLIFQFYIQQACVICSEVKQSVHCLCLGMFTELTQIP